MLTRRFLPLADGRMRHWIHNSGSPAPISDIFKTYRADRATFTGFWAPSFNRANSLLGSFTCLLDSSTFLFSASNSFPYLASCFDLCYQKTRMSERSICCVAVSCHNMDLGYYWFTHLLHQHPPERMSIRVLPSSLDHPIRGDVSFFILSPLLYCFSTISSVYWRQPKLKSSKWNLV